MKATFINSNRSLHYFLYLTFPTNYQKLILTNYHYIITHLLFHIQKAFSQSLNDIYYCLASTGVNHLITQMTVSKVW